MHSTLPRLRLSDFPTLKRRKLETVQVNLGYRCNQQCQHCHVNAGPKRKEAMARETVDQVLDYLQICGAGTLDITGGAPELNPNFRHLVSSARQMDRHVIDRCNLTILLEPGQTDLGDFLASHGVHVVASLPCYLEDNVDRQRGHGVFKKSILGLRRLNRLGYGQEESGLELDLVYNPQGVNLPPAQAGLENAYKEQLFDKYGIVFNRLFTLTNMPIQRFGSMLISKGQFDQYMRVLKDAFQAANLESVMCRSLVSIDWQGYLYDCDFNQQLALPMVAEGCHRIHVSQLHDIDLTNQDIVVMDHCYGCTAGQGSSCTGALDFSKDGSLDNHDVKINRSQDSGYGKDPAAQTETTGKIWRTVHS